MDQIIKVSEGEIGGAAIKTVHARELHAFLESRQDFSTWVKARIEQYGFVENLDFTVHKFVEGRVSRIDYFVSIDMAKELSMVERSEKGKQARQYFIECERRLTTSPVDLNDPAFLRSTLLAYTEKTLALEAKLTEQAPAVEFAHAIRNTADAISIGDFAKVLGTGRNRFFDMLRGDHLLMADNRPYQQYIDRGYFRVIETSWTDAAGNVHPTFKTLITGHGQVYLQRKYGATSGCAA